MGGLRTVFFFPLLLRCRVTLDNSFTFAVLCFVCLENRVTSVEITNGLETWGGTWAIFLQIKKSLYFNISHRAKHHSGYQLGILAEK